MVADPERLQRIDVNLQSILAEAQYLPDLERTWDQLPNTVRVNWDLEWGELMDRLEGLESDYRSGAMTPEQRLAYRHLLRALAAQLPVLKRLDLTLPAVSLDEQAA
jgi:hypothetical protein